MLPENIHPEKSSRRKRISRREMLKIGVTGAAGLVFGPLVSACSSQGAQPAPTNSPTPTSAPTGTNTPTPTGAPTATSTPAATITPASNAGKRLVNSKIVSAKDGRKICYLEAGKPDGIPVVVHHGTPGCRLLSDPCVEDATSRGIRLIGYDRPGYGCSTAYPVRSVTSAADDVAALAMELGLSKILVWGISGGGPHALACAALLPDLVVAVAALAPLAPYAEMGLDWWGGQNAASVNGFHAALKGRDTSLNYYAGFPYYSSTITPQGFLQTNPLFSPLD